MLRGLTALLILILAACATAPGGASDERAARTSPAAANDPAASNDPLLVAAAANVQFAFAEIGQKFTEKTGQPVTFSFGSSGNLTAQIENGAPFDVFAAANVAFVDRLDKQKLIFEKFSTAANVALHSSSKTQFMGGGAGLGLAIARGIIASHKGRIWVESEGYDPEKLPGSKFFILLPIL